MAVGEIGVTVEVQDMLKGKSKVDIALAVDLFESMQLLVGIPEKNAARADGGMDNVSLAFLHSRGSPVNNMPARPFIEPAIEQDSTIDVIAEHFGEAFQGALFGDAGEVHRQLSYAGIESVNAIRNYMGSGALAPNAPITVSGGWMRNKVSGKPFKVAGKGSAAPLIDTSGLRAAVTYVIEGSDS